MINIQFRSKNSLASCCWPRGCFRRRSPRFRCVSAETRANSPQRTANGGCRVPVKQPSKAVYLRKAFVFAALCARHLAAAIGKVSYALGRCAAERVGRAVSAVTPIESLRLVSNTLTCRNVDQKNEESTASS